MATEGRLRRSLDVIVAIAMVSASIAVMAQRRPGGSEGPPPSSKPLPTEPLSFADANPKGSSSAKLVLIEYSDFECPYCGRFVTDTLPELEARYVATGKLLFAFKHLPLPIHKFAQGAAEAAECAGRQGLFWPVHDAVFRRPERLDPTALRDAALGAGASLPAFDKCIASNEIRDKVHQDVESAKTLGVAITPYFFLGSVGPAGVAKALERIEGAAPMSTFEKLLDRHLKAQ